MKTSIGLALGTLAMATTALTAQSPVTFRLEGNADVYNSSLAPQPQVVIGGTSYYSSPYTGAFVSNNTPGAPFLVWCVDYGHESYFNTTYTSEITSVATDPLTYTRDALVPTARNQYDWATVFATDMMPLDFSSSGARQTDVYLQEAMWDAVSDGAYSTVQTSSDKSGFYAYLNALLGTGSYLNDATIGGYFSAHTSTGNGAGWFLIDGVGTPGSTYQEFLAYNPPGNPESLTPEPASLSLMATGLAGVLGAGFRRRKNKKA